MSGSPFLDVPPSAWVASNDLAFALRDGFPVSPGHTLIVPRRLVATWFDATEPEQRAIFALVDVVKKALDTSHAPDGYNVGFNAGPAAGQTVMHLHVHVIPRYNGDMDDPRGGVRGVIPARQKYDPSGSPAPATDPFDDLLDAIVAPDLNGRDRLMNGPWRSGVDRVSSSRSSVRICW